MIGNFGHGIVHDPNQAQRDRDFALEARKREARQRPFAVLGAAALDLGLRKRRDRRRRRR